MNEIVNQKRQELQLLIESHLAPNPAVQGVIVVGSVANGLARPDSDIDAVLFFDPLDYFVVPAEFKWEVESDQFHSISAPGLEGKQTVQFDFKRLDLAQWNAKSFVWPEPVCAGLQKGWIAFDRTGFVEKLLNERTTYTEQLRFEKLDHALVSLDQHLSEEKARRRWQSLEPIVVHNRLHSACDDLVQALFAYNSQWRPWRDREMGFLLDLPWLPDNFSERMLAGLQITSMDEAGYLRRVRILDALFNDLKNQMIVDGTYGEKILDEAFIRSHDEPGRFWNMAEWNRKHQERYNNTQQ